jgi:hypothetical protein
MGHAFFLERLYNHCQGLSRTLSVICTRFNVILCRIHCRITSGQIRDSKQKNVKISMSIQLHEILYSQDMLVLIIYCCIALLQLLYRWHHQSQKLWMPHHVVSALTCRKTFSTSVWYSLCVRYSETSELSWCCDRWSIGLSILVSGTLLGSITRFLFFLSFAGQSLYSSSWDALSDGSVMCSAICQWLESRRTHNHTLLSHLRLLGSLLVASYDSQGLRWKYSNPPPHGEWNLYTRRCNWMLITFMSEWT